MGDDNHEDSRVDTEATRIVIAFAKRCTRRGVLSRVGRMLLRITGVLIVPLLPVDRMVPDAEAQAPCSNWRLCGLYGRLCGCCGGG